MSVPLGEEEQGSMPEVSYYSYEYDSDPFLADGEGGNHFDIPEGGGGVQHKVPLQANTQLPTMDTKSNPERWYVCLWIWYSSGCSDWNYLHDFWGTLITKLSLLFSLSSTEIHRPKPYAHLKIVPYLWICLWMERKWRLCRLAWTESWCGLGTEFMFLVEWSQSGCFHHVCLFLCVVGCEWEWFKTRILRTFLLINSQRRIFIQCAAFIITSL